MTAMPLLQAPLPWQLEEWQRVRRVLAEGRLHHGLLLSGPAGIGKRLLGELLARSVLCRSPHAGEACGRCRDCELFAAGSHPDLLRVEPEEPGKQIRIDQIRSGLAEFVMRTARVAAAKVAIIDPADAMNMHTANCLLKSLEEPAPHTHIVLLSDAPARLLPTVRSRCLQVRLGPPTVQAAGEWLCGLGSDEDGADLLGIAAGTPLGALRVRERGGLEHFDRVAALLQHAAEPRAWIASLVSTCADLELPAVLDAIFLFLLDLQTALVTGDDGAARIRRAVPIYQRLMEVVDTAHVARMLQRTVEARRDAVSGANPNRQLLLEALLLEWHEGCRGA